MDIIHGENYKWGTRLLNRIVKIVSNMPVHLEQVFYYSLRMTRFVR